MRLCPTGVSAMKDGLGRSSVDGSSCIGVG